MLQKESWVELPFKDAFFRTFIAYNWPASGPRIFLTRNTCEDRRDLDTNTHRCAGESIRSIHSLRSPCQKNPGRGLWAVRTETDQLSHNPLSHDGWLESPYMSLHPTQTVDMRYVARHTSPRGSWVWSAVLTQCEKDSPSSMGSSMTWCPLICRQTRFHQKASERANAATNLHHPSFLAERDCDTAWRAPTHAGLKLIWQIKLVTCKKQNKTKKITQKNIKLLSPFNWADNGGRIESILLSTSSCPALLLPT